MACYGYIIVPSTTATMATTCLILHPFILSRIRPSLMLFSAFIIFMVVMRSLGLLNILVTPSFELPPVHVLSNI